MIYGGEAVGLYYCRVLESAGDDFSGDAELWGIVGLSLRVSGSAIVIAALVIIPLFTFIGLRSFRGERVLSRVLNALMSMPSVVVGLLVSVCLSRRGPLGHLQLMYTPTA